MSTPGRPYGPEPRVPVGAEAGVPDDVSEDAEPIMPFDTDFVVLYSGMDVAASWARERCGRCGGTGRRMRRCRR